MYHKILAAFAAISLAGMPVSVSANPTSLSIIIENHTPEMVQCGYTEESARAAIRSAMRYNRISETANNPVYAYVSFGISNSNREICAGHYSVNIRSIIAYPLEGREVFGTFHFCNKTTMFNMRPLNSSSVYERMRDDFNGCLSQIADFTV